MPLCDTSQRLPSNISAKMILSSVRPLSNLPCLTQTLKTYFVSIAGSAACKALLSRYPSTVAGKKTTAVPYITRRNLRESRFFAYTVRTRMRKREQFIPRIKTHLILMLLYSFYFTQLKRKCMIFNMCISWYSISSTVEVNFYLLVNSKRE